MDPSSVHVLVLAALTGALQASRAVTPRDQRRAERNEHGAVDTRAVLLCVCVIAVTVLAAIGKPVPAALSQIVIAVIGGAGGATAVLKRRK